MPITITGVRFSYCNLFQPKAPYNNPQGEPKYSCTVLVPKTNTAAKAAIDQAVAAAIEAGVSAKWSGVRPVSYTHLDVYKRQGEGGARPNGETVFRDGLCPQSGL